MAGVRSRLAAPTRLGMGAGCSSTAGAAGSSNGVTTNGGPSCTSPLGPGGEAVTDSFYFLHQPLAGNDTITVRVTSMNGSSAPWSKAGIIVKASLTQGSALVGPYSAPPSTDVD